LCKKENEGGKNLLTDPIRGEEGERFRKTAGAQEGEVHQRRRKGEITKRRGGFNDWGPWKGDRK